LARPGSNLNQFLQVHGHISGKGTGSVIGQQIAIQSGDHNKERNGL